MFKFKRSVKKMLAAFVAAATIMTSVPVDATTLDPDGVAEASAISNETVSEDNFNPIDDDVESNQSLGGKCGENAYYYYGVENGVVVLKITGTGDMYDYKSIDEVPWHVSDYLDGITKNGLKVSIAKGITSIGSYAFAELQFKSGANNWDVIEVPEGVKSIGDYAFKGTTGNLKVTLPESVEKIGTGMCYGGRILSINIPDAVEVIPEDAFREAPALMDVTITDKSSLKRIERMAFSDCPYLKEINFPDGLEYIGEYAFNKGATSGTHVSSENGYNSMKSIVIPASVEFIGFRAFMNRDLTTSVVFEDTDEKPSQLKVIGGYAFCSSGMETLKIPRNVTRIGYRAFSSCDKVQSIVLNDKLNRIDTQAFSGCTSLSSITIPDSVSYLGGSVFSSTSRSLSIIDKGGWKYVHNDASFDLISNYYNGQGNPIYRDGSAKDYIGEDLSYSLTKNDNYYTLTISGSGTTMEDFYFVDSENSAPWGKFATNINKLVFNTPNLEYIGSGAFARFCITEINLPDSVKKVGDYAFENCKNVEERLVLPRDLEEIGRRGFYLSSCPAITFNSKLKKIGYSGITIRGDANEPIVIPASVEELGECAIVANYCVNASFEEGTKITTIPKRAISGRMKEFKIPDSVTKLADEAFSGLSLTKIDIPASVQVVGDRAFYNSRYATEITLHEGLKVIGKDAFKTYEPVTITIPKSVYKISEYAFASSDITFVDEKGGWTDVNKKSVPLTSYIPERGYEDGEEVFSDVPHYPKCTIYRVGADITSITDGKTKPVEVVIPSFDNATVTTTFPGFSTAGSVANWDPVSGPINGIEAKKIVVKIGGKVVDAAKYDVTYSNNKAVGKASLTIAPKSGVTDYQGSKTVKFTIKGLKITGTNVKYTYEKTVPWNGERVTGEDGTHPTLIITNGSDILQEGKDYLVVYQKNAAPGSALMTVIGIGDYEGSIDLAYTISKPSIADAENCTVTFDKNGLTYTGIAQTPAVSVNYKFSNEKTVMLVAGKDFTVTYKNNVNAYTYENGAEGFKAKYAPTIIVKGKGAYAGKVTEYFVIARYNLNSENVVITAPAVKYKELNEGEVNKSTPVVKVTLYKANGTPYVKTLKAGVDYNKLTSADYYSSDGFKTIGLALITGKAGSNYTGSKEFAYHIGNKNITSKNVVTYGNLPSFEFTGDEIELTEEQLNECIKSSPVAATATTEAVPAKSLRNGQDYTVDYANNTNAGTAKVIITGKGEYYGKKTLTFSIKKRKLTAAEKENPDVKIQDGINYQMQLVVNGKNTVGKAESVITDATDTGLNVSYYGYAHKADFIITDTKNTADPADDYTLKLGKDYKVAYKNNTNVGVAKVIVTFAGNYSGSMTKTFVISKWAMESATITVEDVVYNNGKELTPKVHVVLDGIEVNKKAFKLTCYNNKLASVDVPDSQPSVRVKSANVNYISNPETTVRYPFEVKKADLSTAVLGSIKAVTYAGKPAEPKVSVTYKKKVLRLNTDYTLSYSYNDRKGVATVSVNASPKGNYTGTISKTFLIK